MRAKEICNSTNQRLGNRKHYFSLPGQVIQLNCELILRKKGQLKPLHCTCGLQLSRKTHIERDGSQFKRRLAFVGNISTDEMLRSK